MSFLIHRIAKAFTVGALLVTSAFAATNKTGALPKISVSPKSRIVDKIDNSKVTLVSNTHSARVNGLADLGRVSPSMAMSHLMLVLKSTDEQEYALHALIDQQQDKGHANFRLWETPESFGQTFGVHPADIAKITAWLQDGGFTIDNVAKGARIITFSGTAGQVEKLFHTEMHSYMVGGEVHTSNSTDISIPTALASVVAGPARLNDFRIKNNAKALQVTLDPTTHKVLKTNAIFNPNLSNGPAPSPLSPNGDYVGGGDLAKIYNATPLFAQGIQGQGVTLGIIGQTDVLLSDIQTYRSLFGLPQNNYQRVQIGTDPGTIADDVESDLDLEVSGAMAPLATQIFYTSGNSYFGGGIDSSMEYVIEDNNADIISESYGECEANAGAGYEAFINIVYEQGAAQGQSIFISSGDDGPDTCGSYYATNNPFGGYSVNGLASTPYNVAVGGTIFNEGTSYKTPSTLTTGTPYWGPISTAIPYTSALGFIPDQPWNESIFGLTKQMGDPGVAGGFTGGGSGISLFFGLPNYQVGPGVPTSDPNPPAGSYEVTIPAGDFQVAGPHRYMPDVSLNAAVYHDGTIFCSEGGCEVSNGGFSFGIVGGTSVAAPTMAGAQALINQKNMTATNPTGRQGVPNYYYYSAAAYQAKYGAACIASAYVAGVGCAFHDSQAGNNDVPAVRNSTTQEIGWNAGPGYDLAVGLNSPDVANLANMWSSLSFNATTTSFTLTPTTSAQGATYTVNLAVTPVSTTKNIPTGNISIIAQNPAIYGGLGFYTLPAGTSTITGATLTGLPGGTYKVCAHYSGDTNFGASTSPCISVTVATGNTTVAAISESLVGTNLTPTVNFAYGTNVYINMGVSGSTGVGLPSGQFSLTLTSPTVTLANMPYITGVDPNGTQIGNTIYSGGGYFDAGLGLTAYDIAPTYPVLPVGVYTATVKYLGDSTFNPGTATPFVFTVGPITQKITASGPATVPSGGTFNLSATIATIDPTNGGVPAGGGLVTFTDTTTNTVLATGTMVNGTVTVQSNKLITAGGHAVTASYAGDTNYAAVTSAAITITVGGTATTTTLAITPTTGQVGTTFALTATVPLASTGTVSFYDGGILLGTSGNVSSTTHTATLNYGTFIATTHNITATYNGTGSTTTGLDTSTSGITPLVVTQNTPSVQLTTQNASNTLSSFAMAAVFAPSPRNLTTMNPAPTGPISFTDTANGATTATTLGTAPIILYTGNTGYYLSQFQTATLVPGYHVLAAKYPGDANYAAAPSNTVSIAIGLTKTVLTVSNTGSTGAVTTTLAAKVTPIIANTPVLTGSVTFFNGTVAIGTAQIIGTSATATLPIPYIGLVTGSFTAVYSGDSNYYTSTSNVVSNPFFTIAVNPTALTITKGTSGSVQVIATTYGGYAGTAPLSCSGLPANSYCTFSYTGATVLPTSGSTFVLPGTNGVQAQQITLTITTLLPHEQGVKGSSLLWLPALMLAGFLGLRRKQLSLRGRQLMVMAILLCGTLAMTACSSLSMATPSGTSTVTVTANGVGTAPLSPNVAPTATIALTVQ